MQWKLRHFLFCIFRVLDPHGDGWTLLYNPRVVPLHNCAKEQFISFLKLLQLGLPRQEERGNTTPARSRCLYNVSNGPRWSEITGGMPVVVLRNCTKGSFWAVLQRHQLCNCANRPFAEVREWPVCTTMGTDGSAIVQVVPMRTCTNEHFFEISKMVFANDWLVQLCKFFNR